MVRRNRRTVQYFEARLGGVEFLESLGLMSDGL